MTEQPENKHPEKTKRKCRFSQDECTVLIEEYGKNKSIINVKFSDTVTLKKKKQAWDKICSAVNSVNPLVVRTVSEIKKKWQDIKSSTKTKEGKRRKEMKKTGGGGAETVKLTENEEQAVAHIGDTAIEGIEGGIDTHDGNPDSGNDVGDPSDDDITQPPAEDTLDVPLATPPTSDNKGRKRAVSPTVEDDSVNNISSSKAIKKRKSAPLTSDDWNCNILGIEEQRLDKEKQRLQIEQRRLAIEERRLRL